MAYFTSKSFVYILLVVIVAEIFGGLIWIEGIKIETQEKKLQYSSAGVSTDSSCPGPQCDLDKNIPYNLSADYVSDVSVKDSKIEENETLKWCLSHAMVGYGGAEEVAKNPQEFEDSPEKAFCIYWQGGGYESATDWAAADDAGQSAPDLLDVCVTVAVELYGGFEIVHMEGSLEGQEYGDSPERAFCYRLWFGDNFEEYL